MLKYVLFDLDGTLTESGPGIKNGVRYALRSVGIVEEDEAVLDSFIGPSLVDSFSRVYGKTQEEGFHLQDVFREYYNVKGVYENEPYPGVLSLLKNLREKGCVLVLASSKPLDMATKVLTHFELQPYFDIVVCGEDHGPLFTKSGVIAEAIRRCAIHAFHSTTNENAATCNGQRTASDLVTKSLPSFSDMTVSQKELDEIKKNAVMVGDRIYDMEGAENNGISAIGAGWGYAPAGELESTKAICVCRDVAALEQFLTEKEICCCGCV